MKTDKVKIGVLGAASIAVKSVIPAITELSDSFELVGVASRSLKKSEKVATLFETGAFGNYDELLDKNLIDAVYIPLPNSLHYEWVKKALQSGIHVLVEKSLGCSLSEVKELNDLARANDLTLIENFQFRFHSQLAFIKNQLESGVIGDLRCVRSSFGFPPFPDQDNIRYKSELGGGALLDAGAYPTKIAQIFLGQTLEASASNLSYDETRAVDIWGGAYLKQRAGNLFAEIAFGFDNFYQCSLELWGSKGRIYANRIFTAPFNYSPEIVIEVGSGKEVLRLEPDHHFKNMLSHFFEMIKTGEKKHLEYEQNINQARLLEAIKQKADEQ